MTNLLEGLITRADIADLAEQEELILDDEERISVLEAMHSIDVQACPGSGKTTLIAAKLILLAKKWPHQHQGVCVLSHTNVAKDEIIERIKRSKIVEAQHLLSYPHFIGTIQEFVNRFLAFPKIRSDRNSDLTVDNDEYSKMAVRLLALNQFGWLRGTLNGLGDQSAQIGFLKETYRGDLGNGGDVNISKIPRFWRQAANRQRAERSLEQLKRYLDERGFFLFRDMYAHAQSVCCQNDQLVKVLRKRFLCVFLDEMQDTQKFQDDLLSDIFPLDDETSIVQRFGDPDQAIFHGIGNEEPNESFNEKSRDEMSIVIHKSHRFDGGLADKIKQLSLNEVPLETELTDAVLVQRAESHSSGGPFQHTVIVFRDETRGRVIEQFTNIVSDQFSNDMIQSEKFSVKVIGAVGNEIEPAKDQLKIGHYWDGYDKLKSKSNYKENTLIEAARHCREMSTQDWAQSYKYLVDCILKLLRMTGVRDENGQFYSASKLREKLIGSGNWRNLREALISILNENVPLDQDAWGEACTQIKKACEIENATEEAETYLAFEEEKPGDPDDDGQGVAAHGLGATKDNRIRHPSGIEIQLSTIHGVKGETHDATLVFETKNHTFDMETMLPYLVGDLPNDDHPNRQMPGKPNSRRAFKPNKVFMRQLYVAMSRPKHLLCIALRADHLTGEHEEALLRKGWEIERL